MIDIGRFAFDNKKLINFLIFVLLLGGSFAAYDMSKLEDPEIKVKTALVVSTYPGASAHQVEMEVTDVLEKSIRSMNNISYVSSYSYNDISLIEVELEPIVPDDEVEQYWDLLRRKVDDARASLPAGAVSMVKDDFGNVYGMFYALVGEGLSDRELSNYAELVKREVGEIDGVDRVELYGKREECINISLLQDKMSNLGVSPAEVLMTLTNQNKTAYAGYYKNGSNRIRINVGNRFDNIDDIRNLIIEGHEDDLFYLKDIATIEKDYEEPVRNELFYDGETALGILISASSEADITKVGKKVEKLMADLKSKEFPAGVRCEKVFNQPDQVKNSLGTFVINLIESVAIVILILMITMGLRSGIIIGISLVTIVFGTFMILNMFDGTMQRVSLGAFVLAMGMLVDNAIVIVDGILVDIKKGKDKLSALTDIGKQTALPLLGATLIAIIAFLPIFMSPDTAGVYTRDLFIVLAVSLMISWVLALTHVPLMAGRILVPKYANQSDGKSESLYDGKIYKLLGRVLTWGLNHRLSFTMIMIVLLLSSVMGFGYMKQGFFPDMVYSQLYLEYKLPEGKNYTQVQSDLTDISEYLKTRKEITHITMSSGGAPGRYNLVRCIPNPSLSYGELIIDFESSEALEDNMNDIQDYLTENYPDAYVKLKRYNLMYKKYPIEVMFSGPDPEVLHQLSDSAMAVMQHSDDVCAITTDWEPSVPVMTINYTQPAARMLGLSRSDVSMSVLAATEGIPVGSFYEGIHRNNIYLKSVDYNGNSIDNLHDAQIFPSLPALSMLLSDKVLTQLKTGTLDKGELISSLMASTPLKQICNGIDIQWESPVVPRYNGQRCQRVQCSPAPGVETEKARLAIAEKIEAINLPVGYKMEWQGEKSASTESMRYLFKSFPLAIIMMISILILLFKDYKKPMIIFCCVPLVMVGVIISMLITGKVFNFVAIVGSLGLIGMIIKNGIVLMDEISLRIREGAEPKSALISSSMSRLRPVSMASLTTVLGMFPLLSDAMFGSLAASVIGGLIFGTVITLLYIPVLFSLFFKIK